MESCQQEPLDKESQDWYDADLSRLGEYEPFDWAKDDPETLGQRIVYDTELGFHIQDSARATGDRVRIAI